VAPGRMPPSPSGKPIIVSNRPIIKDPMAPTPLKSVSGALHPAVHAGSSLTSTLLTPSNGNTEQQLSDAVRLPGRRTMKTISVLDHTPDTAGPDDTPLAGTIPDESSDPVPPQPSASSKVAANSTVAAPKASKDEIKDDKPTGVLTDGAQSSDVPLADNARQRAEQEHAARLAEEEKIVASKQYYLPIKDAKQRRGNSRAVLWLVLALLATLVWLDLVLDAGVAHLGGLHALTHFFTD
jgi:hypothetical protein